MTLEILTGDWYPVKALSYVVKNISLPPVVVDQLRAALRMIHEDDRRANTFKRWSERVSSASGIFDFEMGTLHIVTKTADHVKEYRKDPAYWRNHSHLQHTDYKLSLERRLYLRDIHGIDDLVPDDGRDDSDRKEHQRYDPFNPDWSRKATDLTDEQKLAFSSVEHKSEIISSMFGVDPKSITGHDLANSILGKTSEAVCANIPEIFRILHIESVVRSDLVAKFFSRQAKIRDGLGKLPLNILKGSVKRETRLKMGKRANEPQTLIDHLVSPDLTFHCTREDLVPSIVRQGFFSRTRRTCAAEALMVCHQRLVDDEACKKIDFIFRTWHLQLTRPNFLSDVYRISLRACQFQRIRVFKADRMRYLDWNLQIYDSRCLLETPECAVSGCTLSCC